MRHHIIRPFRHVCFHGSVAAFLLGFAPSPVSRAVADSALTAESAKGDETFDDLKLNLQARKLLQQDKRLAGLNVGVTVQDRIATLWGPMPSADAAKEAIERVKQIRGIVRVVDETKVSPPIDTLPEQVVAAVRKQAKEAPSVQEVPSVVTAKVEPRPEPERSTVVAAKPTALRTAEPVQPAAVLLRPVIADGPLSDFGSMWERLRLKETRFKEVTLDSHAGVIRINGSVSRMADAWDLAEMLAEFPGVKLVLLDKVEAK